MADEYWNGIMFATDNEKLDVQNNPRVVVSDSKDVVQVDTTSPVMQPAHVDVTDNEPVVKNDRIVVETEKVTVEDNELDVENDSITAETEKETVEDDILKSLGVDITESLQGLRAKTMKEMQSLYKMHASALGFSIKKGTSRTRNGMLVEKYFFCCCQGKSGKSKEKNESSVTPSPTQDTDGLSNKRKRKRKVGSVVRTGCKANIRIKWDAKIGVYVVKHHIMEHNHPFTRSELQYLNQSNRSITDTKGMAISEMEVARGNILKYWVQSTCGETWVQSAGREENVGCTKKDHTNHVNKLRMKDLDGCDVQKVVDELNRQQEEDPNFFFRLKFDDDGKLCAIFWRDALMKKDYQLYGDVVVFDTTCNTNRYNFICAPFLGVNNHCYNVMFGCAFIGDEKEESFIWLLQMFKKSMGDKPPVTIFTDQDLAISNAIKEVFKDSTRHRLCLWYIQQSFISHFGELKRNTQFKEEFDHCLKGCSNEEVFENCWNSMLKTYGLEGNPWFKHLYGLREKWCTALSKDFFSSGFLSCQRSETMYNAICFDANETTSLCQFFDIFLAITECWRNMELQKKFQCSHSIPKASIKTGLLKHAAEVYTLSVFKYFEEEFGASIGTTISIESSNDETSIFSVAPEEESQKSERVVFSRENENIRVKCSCKHFEEVGWLCFHCLRVLHYLNVSQIPSEYILDRWTKVAKIETNSPSNGDFDSWRQQMARNYYNLMLKSEGKMEARRIIEDGYNRDSLSIEELQSTQFEGGVGRK